jgi:hypothetical protein
MMAMRLLTGASKKADSALSAVIVITACTRGDGAMLSLIREAAVDSASD